MDLERIYYQLNSTWNASYTFSGKEKDVETCYGYVKKLRFFSSLAFGNEKQVFHYAHCLRRFGARYYDSGLSIWLSVDPMSDKYPSMSPYNYCANNPVKLIDPNGMEIDEAATKKDPLKLGHPSRDTFFDPQDDNQRNTIVKPPFVNPQSSKQSGTSSQSGSSTSNNKNSNKGRGGFRFIDNNNPIPNETAEKSNQNVQTIDVTGPLEIIKSSVNTLLELFGASDNNDSEKLPKTEWDKPTEKNYINYSISEYAGSVPYMKGRVDHNGTKKDSVEAVEKVKKIANPPCWIKIE